MAYTIDVDPDAQQQIFALSTAALTPLAEAMTVLELTPWNGSSLNRRNPGGAVRTLTFGQAGMITYLILENQKRVDVLSVLWLDPEDHA